MLNVVCAKTIILWVFNTASKLSPVHIIRFIPTTLNNEQHTCQRVRVDEYGNWESKTYITNLLVD